MSLLHVRSMQSRHNRRSQVHLLHNVDQALGNGVASYDATKDVDEDGCDFGIAGDQVECGFDGRRSGTTADVEEVGGGTSVQLDDIHCGHGESGTVDWQN